MMAATSQTDTFAQNNLLKEEGLEASSYCSSSRMELSLCPALAPLVSHRFIPYIQQKLEKQMFCTLVLVEDCLQERGYDGINCFLTFVLILTDKCCF